MMSVAVAAPVDPAYVVASVKDPCAVKLPVVPNVRPGPEIALSTELTEFPVAKPARAPVPLRAYGTLIAVPSTTAYVEPESVAAVQPVGIATTDMPLVVSVAVCPSGLVTTTENVTGPAAGLVYVPSDTEWEELVYV